ncbi:MAG: zinc ribbon domain-containing protein [Clostridiales bacterium]|nr:zinc ribbon domain-containing protein [Clostridiales bacterium]
MAFCSKCGTEIDESVSFCPGCGSPVNEARARQAEYTRTAADNDVKENKFFAILSYIGPLVFIPLFARKNSSFAQFHAKQGINLFVIWVVYSILYGFFSLLNGVFEVILRDIPFTIIGLGITAFCVIGIINAAKGQTKELPYIGHIKLF